MYCKYCGTPQDEDAIFCSACGKRINIENADITNNNVSDENIIQTPTFDNNEIVVENDYARLNEDVEFTFDAFTDCWANINPQTRFLLIAAAVLVIVLCALMMFFIFFPNMSF